MYFHTDNEQDIGWLARALAQAEAHGRRIRLDVDSEGNLKVKVGESMWTPPIAGTPDPHRDRVALVDSLVAHEPDTDEGLVCAECRGRDGKHFLNCSTWPWQHGRCS